jgi:hypothetical protein
MKKNLFIMACFLVLGYQVNAQNSIKEWFETQQDLKLGLVSELVFVKTVSEGYMVFQIDQGTLDKKAIKNYCMLRTFTDQFIQQLLADSKASNNLSTYNAMDRYLRSGKTSKKIVQYVKLYNSIQVKLKDLVPLEGTPAQESNLTGITDFFPLIEYALSFWEQLEAANKTKVDGISEVLGQLHLESISKMDTIKKIDHIK